MSNLADILKTLDQLPADELEAVYRHLVQRRHAGYWLVAGETITSLRDVLQPLYAETDTMSETEINSAIDAAVDEVRRGAE